MSAVVKQCCNDKHEVYILIKIMCLPSGPTKVKYYVTNVSRVQKEKMYFFKNLHLAQNLLPEYVEEYFELNRLVV